MKVWRHFQKWVSQLNYLSTFQLSVVKPKPKQLKRPIRRKENTFESQWELKVKTTKLPEARRGHQVVIGFSLVPDWLSGTSFLDKSNCKEKQNQHNFVLLLTLNWKLVLYPLECTSLWLLSCTVNLVVNKVPYIVIILVLLCTDELDYKFVLKHL